jgi:uncharacterized protein YcbX
LLYQTEDDLRLCSPNFAPAGPPTSLADEYQALVGNDATLRELNGKLSAPLTIYNFRPNVVVSNALPRAENTWARIGIGEAILDLVKPCTRCQVITVDRETGTFLSGPLSRREPYAVLTRDNSIDDRISGERVSGCVFGENAVPIKTGYLQVKDPIRIISRKPAPGWKQPLVPA